MSTAVQLRRGTTAEHAAFTGGVGEVTVDTTKDTLVVHDGVTAGGFPVVEAALLGDVVTEQTSSVGAIIAPVGTTAERPTPAAGLLRFNTDTPGFEGYDGSAWAAVGGGNSTTSGMWENSSVISANYTVAVGNNALSSGPIVINSGVSVKVPSGSRWAIV